MPAALIARTYTPTPPPAGGNALLGFTLGSIQVKEEGAPTLQVSITRSVDTSAAVSCTITSSNGTAIAGTNYRAVNETVNWGIGVTEALVDVGVFFDKINDSDITFDLTLSAPSAGAELANPGYTITVTIQGDYGLWADGFINAENYDTADLTSSSVISRSNSATETFEYLYIDATGNDYGIHFNGASNKTVENVVIKNANLDAIRLDPGCSNITINNVVLIDSNKSVAAYEGMGIYVYQPGNNIIMKNIYVIRGNGGVRFEMASVSPDNIQLTDIYYTDPQGQGGTGNIAYGVWMNGVTNFLVRRPTVHAMFATSETEDHISFYECDGSVAHPIRVEEVVIYGGGPSNSGGGCMCGDYGGSYQQYRYGIVVNAGQYGIGFPGGFNCSVDDFDIYSGPDDPGMSRNNVGCYGWRQIDTPAGDFYGCSVGNIRVRYYDGPTTTNDQWHPTTGWDGGYNHGIGSHTDISGWSSIQSMTTWGNDSGQVGYSATRDRVRPLRQPAISNGIYCWHADENTALGDGTLTFTLSGTTLSWAEYGDTAGTPVDVSSDGLYYLASNNGNTLCVVIEDSALLPSGNTSWTNVAITRFKVYEYLYPGSNGDWT